MESNHRHEDFQSSALPTELSGRNGDPAAKCSQDDMLAKLGDTGKGAIKPKEHNLVKTEPVPG